MTCRLLAAAAIACCATAAADAALAEQASNRSPLDKVQVTATRFGEQVQEVPLSMTVVTGEDIRARGARDLRSALALVGGIQVAQGGDAGPSGAVPGLLGMREVDDFLLLIDGIPAGGAFLPQFEAVNLNNVERIEILRGMAPVYFGTTAFAGTVNVVHYPAGKAASAMTLTYGSFGAAGVEGSTVLSTGELKQSISGALESQPDSNPRSGFKRAEATYRMAMPLAGGVVRVDLSALALRQKPGSPSPVDNAGRLGAGLPVDFNQNPADARLNTERYQLVLGYNRRLAIGDWGTTVSLTHSTVNSTRGFLVDRFLDAAGDNAAGAVQHRQLADVFIDSHITARPVPWLMVTYGFNELYGRASQQSTAFTYAVPLGAGMAPASSAGTPTDAESLADRRNFFGVYGQTRILASDRLSILAGLRWNHTDERRVGQDADGSLAQAQTNNRWSGSIGAQLKVWRDASGDFDDVMVHANLGRTFQPTQVDFGPDAARSPILQPETQRSFQAGIKADGLDGRFDLDLSAFAVNFDNQAVTAQEDGQPVLRNGGRQRVTGWELEGTYRLQPGLNAVAHVSHSKARYVDFNTLQDGVVTQLAGNALPLSARVLAGAGLMFAPMRGWQASLVASYTGRRFLDMGNAVEVPGYTTIDASLGYVFEGGVKVSMTGTNLSNRRDAVLASEIGEGQLYRRPARRWTVGLTVPLH
ncbi:MULTISPECIES: TonB-dependent receptor [Ramlibacter]|uniref:TonB-dependent receptor n=1 Tax=Ramlibacter aquaticus TaxID=2780094 RepID=A0ABR9SJK1_9BURK|nr:MULTISPECIES: TonB-dependent receptor [Ramlibacter]MBE7942483.1 TonB-dependent receptor [Ramlibacter aquaticus]